MPAAEKNMPDIPEALAAERAYLAAARAELGRMRARTLALDADKAGGSALSSEYLKGALYYRAQALIDDPETPLFFGRLDMGTEAESASSDAGRPAETTYYVGRRHVHDDDGDPVVVDWRADVSRAFYRATRTEPMDVVLRRRFGFERGHITAYEDEHLLAPREGDAQRSRILASEIERPRVGPMRDIVATIQPEQDVIVRADVNETICVQGAPGTGKTAVGLHRAAYLLYAFRDRLRRGGVLIVGPNTDVPRPTSPPCCPRSARSTSRQVTVDELVARRAGPGGRTARGGDAQGRRAHGDGAATTRCTRDWPRRPSRSCSTVGRGGGGCPPTSSRELVDELTRRDVRYGAGRAMLAQRLAHAAAHQDGGRRGVAGRPGAGRGRAQRAGQGDGQPALAGGRPGAPRALRAVRPPTSLAAAADRRARPTTSRRCCCGPRRPAARRRARWSSADAVLVDEARDLVERDAEPRPRRARRGAGPEPDAAARRRPALLDRRRDRARRPRPGHHPVGQPPTGRPRWPTSASPVQPSRCSSAAIACRRPSSTSPAGCCRRSRPASLPPVSVRENPGTLDFVGGDAVDRARRRRAHGARASPAPSASSSPTTRSPRAGQALRDGRHRARRARRRRSRASTGSRSSRRRWPRGWSSTTSSSSSRTTSSRPSRAGGSACDGSTSC